MNNSDLIVVEALPNGRMGKKEINTNAVANVFAHVTSSQRAEGLVDYAKTWWKVKDINNAPLLDPESYHDKPTKSLDDDDYVVMWESDPRTANTQEALAAEAATADKYGSAYLATDLAAGATVIDVNVKHANLLPGGIDAIFRNGGKIKACSHADALATDGKEEIRTISADPVIVEGLKVRLTVSVGLANAYTANGTTRVSSLIKPTGDIKPTVTDFTVNTVGDGDYDIGGYPLLLDNIATVEEDITHTFSDGSAFTATGDTIPGTIGSGSKIADFAPNNSDFTRPYYTMEAAGYNGVFALNDTITFTIHAAGLPIGQKRFVKEGARSLSNNMVAQVFGGEAN